MQSILPKTLIDLITEFSKLPGIGPKTAERLTFYLMKQNELKRKDLAGALENLTKGLTYCGICQNIAENNPCLICQSKNRNQKIICVVEEPFDVLAIESTNEYQGLYHVLHGALSPIDDVNPEDLKIKELQERIENSTLKPEEVIIATNPSLEGEATAMYIVKILKPLDINFTRIARGLPVGGNLEYADQITIGEALSGRRKI